MCELLEYPTSHRKVISRVMDNDVVSLDTVGQNASFQPVDHGVQHLLYLYEPADGVDALSSLSPWLPSFPVHLLEETHHIVGFPPSPTYSPPATLSMSPLFFENTLLFVF